MSAQRPPWHLALAAGAVLAAVALGLQPRLADAAADPMVPCAGLAMSGCWCPGPAGPSVSAYVRTGASP